MAKRAAIDPDLTADAAQAALARGPWRLAWDFKALSAPEIRKLVAREVGGAHHRFLQLAVPADGEDSEVIAAWRAALVTILDLDTSYAWESEKRRAKVRKVAASARMLEAIQGTCATSSDVPLDMLAVLVADGSDASIDALIPHLDPALVTADVRLDKMSKLRAHAAKAPRLRALLDEVEETRRKRAAASPVLALGPVIGVGRVSVLWFHVFLESLEHSRRTPRANAMIRVDSRQADYLIISVSADVGREQISSSFNNTHVWNDGLGLGTCALPELPRWLAATTARLGVTWKPRLYADHRGKKRDAILRWLLGG